MILILYYWLVKWDVQHHGKVSWLQSYGISSSRNQSFQFCVFMLQHHMLTIVWRWWLFQEWDMGIISLYITPPSNEMFNIMEWSHSCKVMEYPVLGTNHLNFVYLCGLSLFQEWGKCIISFYIIAPSNEMFNIMERSHGCKVLMEYPVVGTYHFNFVYLCDNNTWWPFYVVCHCSKKEIWIHFQTILVPSQLKCST